LCLPIFFQGSFELTAAQRFELLRGAIEQTVAGSGDPERISLLQEVETALFASALLATKIGNVLRGLT
jgi:hypothetical protein